MASKPFTYAVVHGVTFIHDEDGWRYFVQGDAEQGPFPGPNEAAQDAASRLGDGADDALRERIAEDLARAERLESRGSFLFTECRNQRHHLSPAGDDQIFHTGHDLRCCEAGRSEAAAARAAASRPSSRDENEQLPRRGRAPPLCREDGWRARARAAIVTSL